MYNDYQHQKSYLEKVNDFITSDTVVNAAAGLGDGLLLGQGDKLRKFLNIDGGVDSDTLSYKVGSTASFAAGSGRIAYAGLAKGGSILAKSGAHASRFRTNLKKWFGFGLTKNIRVPNLSKYGSDTALRAASGRTNLTMNVYGAGVAASGANGAFN